MSTTSTTSRRLLLNAKGFAIVAEMADRHGIDPGEASEVPFRATFGGIGVADATLEAYAQARLRVERMTPKNRAKATLRGRELTSNILRRAVPGKEYGFLP